MAAAAERNKKYVKSTEENDFTAAEIKPPYWQFGVEGKRRAPPVAEKARRFRGSGAIGAPKEARELLSSCAAAGSGWRRRSCRRAAPVHRTCGYRRGSGGECRCRRRGRTQKLIGLLDGLAGEDLAHAHVALGKVVDRPPSGEHGERGLLLRLEWPRPSRREPWPCRCAGRASRPCRPSLACRERAVRPRRCPSCGWPRPRRSAQKPYRSSRA